MIAKTINAKVQVLNLNFVSEGVEIAFQQDFLIDQEYTSIESYLCGRPAESSNRRLISFRRPAVDLYRGPLAGDVSWCRRPYAS